MIPSYSRSESARILGKKKAGILLSTFWACSFYFEGFLGLKKHNQKCNIRKQYGNMQRIKTTSDGHGWCEVTDTGVPFYDLKKENQKTLNIFNAHSMHWIRNSEKFSNVEKKTQNFKYDSRPEIKLKTTKLVYLLICGKRSFNRPVQSC